jgi:hypothetical protein
MGTVYDPEDQGAVEAPSEASNDSGADASEPLPRPWQRRRYQVVTAIGVVAVLGTGVLVAQYVRQGGAEVVSGARNGLNLTPDVAASASGDSPGSAAPASAGASAPGSTAHSLPAQPPHAPAHPAVAPTVTNSGSLPKDHHTLRVVSARGDLSGARELTWAADSGHPVGSSRCTQNFRIGPSSPASERPTMLLCWRTSAGKSVYTIAVDIDHRPSERASVATIDTVWSKLG